MNPLEAAARDGRTEDVRQLIVAGANVDQPNEKGATPLWVAAGEGQCGVAR